MRLCRQAFALALIVVATPAAADPSHGGLLLRHKIPSPVIAVSNDRQQDYDIDLIVTMSGRCTTLKIAGRDLACRAVKYFHSRAGRGYFTIAIDDATDNGHIVSFSGENARREGDNISSWQSTRCCSIPRTGRRSTACACRWSSRRAAPAGR